MRESWRWFGPDDPVTLDDIRQTGVTDIVSALHDVPIGDAWPLQAIREHQALIETTPEAHLMVRSRLVPEMLGYWYQLPEWVPQGQIHRCKHQGKKLVQA